MSYPEVNGLIITEVDCRECCRTALVDGQLGNEDLKVCVRRACAEGHEGCLDLALALNAFPFETRLRWYRTGWTQPGDHACEKTEMN